jgi:hypothetical protein
MLKQLIREELRLVYEVSPASRPPAEFDTNQGGVQMGIVPGPSRQYPHEHEHPEWVPGEASTSQGAASASILDALDYLEDGNVKEALWELENAVETLRGWNVSDQHPALQQVGDLPSPARRQLKEPMTDL